MYTLFKKELGVFFSSLTGVLVIIIFLITTGLFLWVLPGSSNILETGYATLEPLFVIAPWLFLFLIPAVTMRLFTEEKKTGTIELLLTKPISEFGIVLAKFYSALAIVFIALLPTITYYISVYLLGNPVGNLDVGGTWGSYIGLLFLVCLYVAIGIFCSALTSNQFVASDAHKLVRYKRNDVKAENDSSFILPQKAASLLKGILPKEEKPVNLSFDEKNAIIEFEGYKLICRLIEGKYPNYEAVIPQDNPNQLTIDRLDFYNTLRRVSVFSNQASNLIKLELRPNQLTVSAQDIDFSISAHERINCQYDGDEMDIGFKSLFLIEILNNLASSDVVLNLSDPSRAGILLPAEKVSDNEDVLMLLMPMMING
jgi:ABC-type transport system involved in cytochrome c biogenesis permease component